MNLLVKVKVFCRKNLQFIYLPLRSIKTNIQKIKNKETKKSYGMQNTDKCIYVIRCGVNGIGLMAYYLSSIGRLIYAEENGYVPYVDMCNYENPYLKEDEIGKTNAWEYYFLQPSKLKIDEVYNSKNVILSDLGTSNTGFPRTFYKELLESPDRYFRIVQKYLHLNPMMEKIIEETKKKLFPSHEKILGVSTRGTDMLNFVGHSKIPPREMLLKQVKDFKEKIGYKYIFLATEEDSMVEFFRQEFGDDLIVDDRKRYDDFKDGKVEVLVKMHFNRENDERLKGQEYLVTVALLAECNSLIGMIIGSTVGAICMNGGKYEHTEIIDLGIY